MSKVKCMCAVIDRPKHRQMHDLLKQNGIEYTYATLALGTAGSELLDYLGIGESDKLLMFCFLPKTKEQKILAQFAAEIHIRKPGHGIVFTMPLASMNYRFQQRVCHTEVDAQEVPMEKCKREYELIAAIVDHGYKDAAMDAARAADATGGTVLHARSYHDESRAHLLGFKVQKEKDVVIILSRRDSARQIMKAINEACGFDSEANGIVFSLPVDHFMGM